MALYWCSCNVCVSVMCFECIVQHISHMLMPVVCWRVCVYWVAPGPTLFTYSKLRSVKPLMVRDPETRLKQPDLVIVSFCYYQAAHDSRPSLCATGVWAPPAPSFPPGSSNYESPVLTCAGGQEISVSFKNLVWQVCFLILWRYELKSKSNIRYWNYVKVFYKF